MPARPLGTDRHGSVVLLLPTVEFAILKPGVLLTAFISS